MLEPPHRQSRALAVRTGIWALCLCAIVALQLRALLWAGGVPAFQQDWIWPLIRGQCIPFTTTGFEPWHSDALGAAAAYPESYMYRSLVGSACIVFGPRPALFVVLFASLLFAAAGFRYLYRQIAVREAFAPDPFIEIAICAIAVANPVLLNKLQAGHLQFIIGYGMLAWLAAYAFEERPGTSIRLGVLLAVATMEPQFLGIGALVIIAFQAYSGTWRPRRLVAALVIAVAANLTIVAPAFMPAARSSLAVQAPVLLWQQAESGHLAEALRLLGYTAHYAERLLPQWLQAGYWVLPACVLVALLMRPRVRYLAILALAVVGIGVDTAWNTPLAFAWTAAYEHFSALALYRELYNAMALTAIAFATLAAIGLSILRQRRLTLMLAAALLLLAGVTAYYSTSGIPTYKPTAKELADLSAIGASAGVTRFALDPAPPPTAPEGVKQGGYSPWFLSFRNHPVLFSPASDNVVLYTDALLNAGNPQASRWLSRDGVGIVQSLGGWHTAVLTNTEPGIARAESLYLRDRTAIATGTRLRPASMVAVEPFSARPGSLANRYAGARDLRPLRGGVPIALQRFTSDISPSTGWGRTEFVPIMPAWSFAEPLGIFTLRPSAVLKIRTAFVVAGDRSGHLRSPACHKRERLDDHFALFACGPDPLFRGKAPIVVSGAWLGGLPAQPQFQSGEPGRASILSYRSWTVRARIAAKAGSAIVLRQAYDPGWAISIPGAKHVMVDGYANAWITPGSVDGTVTITYRPARYFFVLLAISVGTLLCCFGMLLWKRKEN